MRRKLQGKNWLQRYQGFLNAAMLLLAAAVTEAGRSVWVDDFVSAPKLYVQDEDWEAAGVAEVDKTLMKTQLLHAAALAFQSAPHWPDGWAQPP